MFTHTFVDYGGAAAVAAVPRQTQVQFEPDKTRPDNAASKRKEKFKHCR